MDTFLNITPDVLSYAYQLLFYTTLPCIPPYHLSCVKMCLFNIKYRAEADAHRLKFLPLSLHHVFLCISQKKNVYYL